MKLVRFQNPVLTPWSGFTRLSDLREEIDRLFEAPLAEWARTPSLFGGWTPAIDLIENKDNIVVKAELPGMRKEDIEVTLHEGTLNIAGERKSEKKVEEAGLYRSERFFGRFQRAITLPAAVAGDKVKADYKDGILTITLPKTEEAKPKQIDVSIS
jgi:HSP20 family protein